MMKKTVAATIAMILFSSSCFAFFGARPMGMGGAFTAVADDANAPYWNPAGLALNPEVAVTGSTLLNNRNTYVGDNVMNVKMCYETELSPFAWIAGVGLASAMAYEGAKYLSDQGVVQKGWGNKTPGTGRDEAMSDQVKGTGEAVSLKKELKKTAKKTAAGLQEGVNDLGKEIAKTPINVNVNVGIGLLPWVSPWYRPDVNSPEYLESNGQTYHQKAQFALGLSWLNDYNPPLNQNSNWYTLSLASGFEQRIALGANINCYDLTKISTNTRGIGADLDLGFIARPVEYITLGLMGKGLLTTNVNWQDKSSTRYEMIINAGVAIKPLSAITLAADAHNIFSQNSNPITYHYGIEAILVKGILARVGFDNGNKTAGLGVAVGSLIIDYAILGGTYNRTQTLGATWRF